MAHTNITTRIMQSRIRGLTEENRALKAQLAAQQGFPTAENRETDLREPDYGLGGMEWIDPATGADTWHS